MSQDQGAGAPKPDGGAGTDQPGDVGKEVKRFMKKSGMWDRLDKMEQLITGLASKFETAAKPADAQQQQAAQAPSNTAQEPQQERLSMKVLQDQYRAMQARLDAAEKAAKDAEERTNDMRMRSEVKTRLQTKLGPNNPMLDPIMDSLYDVKKRFVDQGGNIAVKFRNEFGEEDFKNLDEGINALFDKGGEYNHLVSQSKAGQLPPNGFGRPTQPLTNHPSAQSAVRRDPVAEMLANLANNAGETEKAAYYAQQAAQPREVVLPIPHNGTTK